MTKTIKFVGAKQEGKNTPKFPSLEELHYKLFGEVFDAHNALNDVEATKRCYEELLRIGII